MPFVRVCVDMDTGMVVSVSVSEVVGIAVGVGTGEGMSMSMWKGIARNATILCDQSQQWPTFELFTLFNTVCAVSYFYVIDGPMVRWFDGS